VADEPTTFWDMRAKLTQPEKPRPAKSDEPWTVAAYAARVDAALKKGLPATLEVRGEVSSWTVNSRSGHAYFSLKDDRSKLDGIIYQGKLRQIDVKPEVGDEVVITGRAGYYGPFGKLSFTADDLRPVGEGALEAAFLKLKATLEAEGIFDKNLKRGVPKFPETVGIVTSRDAAGLADVRKVLAKFSFLTVLLIPVPVQGKSAADRVAAAIAHLNAHQGDLGGLDLLLLIRGGGSREDLWTFNEEVVARAVAASRIPIITGIGHETDVHIADLAADYHAHTPTQAAQTAIEHWKTAADSIDRSAIVLRRNMRLSINDKRRPLRDWATRELFVRPIDRIVERRRQDVEIADGNLFRSWQATHRQIIEQLSDLQQRLARHEPAAVVRANRQRLQRATEALDRAAANRAAAGRRAVEAATASLRATRPDVLLRQSRRDVASLAHRLHAANPTRQIAHRRDDLQVLADRQAASLQRLLERRHADVAATTRQLAALGPEQVLRRGYTLTLATNGDVIRHADDVAVGEEVQTRTSSGTFRSRVL
jgi:exodeoxyribonuclease VII large subunit